MRTRHPPNRHNEQDMFDTHNMFAAQNICFHNPCQRQSPLQNERIVSPRRTPKSKLAKTAIMQYRVAANMLIAETGNTMRKTTFSLLYMPILTGIMFCSMPSSPILALDPGIIRDQRLNVFPALPTLENAIPANQAKATVTGHIARELAQDDRHTAAALPHTYAQDYRKVLKRFPNTSKALAVMVTTPDGTERVARWLVGLDMGTEIGGFFAVDPVDGSIQSPLMFTPDLEPLFRVSARKWNQAPAVNAIPGLNELIPPVSQFTTGIPVDPHAPGVFLIEGLLDLPKKTQEERRDTIEAFNRGPGKAAGVQMHHTPGRRTATSKCLAVAASYLADWWIVATGGKLDPYRNPVGGQQEYGINPRHLESIYYQRAREEAGLVGRAVIGLGSLTGLHLHARGNFKLVGRDRVTREPIPYSPRGYARILSETMAGSVPDPLMPDHVQYEHGNNPFAMDEPPLLMVIDRNLMARRTRRKDERRYDDDDAYFQIAEWNARQHSTAGQEQELIAALHSWGPLYAQHMQRDSKGNPQTGIRAKGVHACVIVGYTTIDDRLHFIYRETFGNANHRYLEDSFLGPSYRAFPVEFFYQAIAFPHTLQLSIPSANETSDGTLDGLLEIRTNRGTARVNPDTISIEINGQPFPDAELMPQETGLYRFSIPKEAARNARHIQFSSTKRHFAAGNGSRTFSTALIKNNQRWLPHRPAKER
jgi:hypothetical protein